MKKIKLFILGLFNRPYPPLTREEIRKMKITHEQNGYKFILENSREVVYFIERNEKFKVSHFDIKNAYIRLEYNV